MHDEQESGSMDSQVVCSPQYPPSLLKVNHSHPEAPWQELRQSVTEFSYVAPNKLPTHSPGMLHCCDAARGERTKSAPIARRKIMARPD